MNLELFSNIVESKEQKTVLINAEYNFEIVHLTPKKGNYQLLLTKGLCSFEQNVKADCEKYKFIELYICLPDYWDLTHQNWPITWLNRLAELPQKNKTWFGPGDTIPAGNPPQVLDEKFKANHFILMPPTFMLAFLNEDIVNSENQSLLAVVPIFPREIKFKLKNSHTMLFNQFAKKGITELCDIYRPVAGNLFIFKSIFKKD